MRKLFVAAGLAVLSLSALPASFAKAAPAKKDSGNSIVIVFKDGHRSEVRNYAIVDNTLFDFDLADGRTRKILLADLDLSATHKANDDRGVDFQIPASIARQ